MRAIDSDLLFGVHMGRANHLWEVDDHGLTALSTNEDVELIEVPVDETRPCKSHDEIHESGVQFSGRWKLCDLAAVDILVIISQDIVIGTYSGYASMNSMSIVWRAWSIGLGTGNSCS